MRTSCRCLRLSSYLTTRPFSSGSFTTIRSIASPSLLVCRELRDLSRSLAGGASLPPFSSAVQYAHTRQKFVCSVQLSYPAVVAVSIAATHCLVCNIGVVFKSSYSKLELSRRMPSVGFQFSVFTRRVNFFIRSLFRIERYLVSCVFARPHATI